MNNNKVNPLLLLDVYKMGHAELYKPGTTKVYSYAIARSDKRFPTTIFYGLQYYLQEYLTIKVKNWMVEEFIEYHEEILGFKPSEKFQKSLYGLVELGYFPLQIKAVDEGTVIPVRNVLFTIVSTHPDYFWMTGFFETLLLMVWNTCTVAMCSKQYKNLCQKYSNETCDNDGHIPYQVHDFGMRGCSSVETAALSGSAHLINSQGSDNVPAIRLTKRTYKAKAPGQSVVATEHSIMCSFGEGEGEVEAFTHVLNLYPDKIVSVVSDTYSFFNVLMNVSETLRPIIERRTGKLVFRPDSGDPEKIICGDPDAPVDSPEWLGAIRILDQKFGSTVNNKGYKVLNPKVGIIYGDGMFYSRFNKILLQLQLMGYASSNLVIGVGGLLLQQHNRDDQGFAIKATFAVIDGQDVELMKDPVTDPGKRSHKGLLCLAQHMDEVDGSTWYETLDQCTPEQEKLGCLKTVFLDGKLTNPTTLMEIRNRANNS